MENILFEKISKLITEKISGRKLVLRWKAPAFEEYLYEKTGLRADFYVTKDAKRINNVDSFSDKVLMDYADDVLLVIAPELARNLKDEARYKGWGFVEGVNLLWMKPGKTLVSQSSSSDYYEDVFGNKVVLKSDANLILTGRNSSVIIEEDVKIFPDTFEILIGENANLHIKKGCRIHASYIYVMDGATLEIGERVRMSGGGEMKIKIKKYSSMFIGAGTTMQTGRLVTGRKRNVKIGEDCMFSWDITILAHDAHLIWDINTGQSTNNTAGAPRESIVIGDHVWLGAQTAVLPNTQIGSGSICGFRSLVRGTIPNNCVCAGSPAKVIRKDIAWSRPNVSTDDRDFYEIDERFRKYTEDDDL